MSTLPPWRTVLAPATVRLSRIGREPRAQGWLYGAYRAEAPDVLWLSQTMVGLMDGVCASARYGRCYASSGYRAVLGTPRLHKGLAVVRLAGAAEANALVARLGVPMAVVCRRPELWELESPAKSVKSP